VCDTPYPLQPSGPSLEITSRFGGSRGVWVCQTHGKLVDDNPSVHSVEEITRWKKQHKDWVFARVSNADNQISQTLAVSGQRPKNVNTRPSAGFFLSAWDDVLGRLVGVQFRRAERIASATILGALA